MTPEVEPLLTTSQLCRALTPLLGANVHRDRVNRRIKMGMPFMLDRGTGRKLFYLSQVWAWWSKDPDAKAS